MSWTKANPKAVWSRRLRNTQVSPCWWSVNCSAHACKEIRRNTNKEMRVKYASCWETVHELFVLKGLRIVLKKLRLCVSSASSWCWVSPPDARAAVQYNSIQHNTISHRTVQHSTSNKQYNTIQYSTTMLCSILHLHPPPPHPHPPSTIHSTVRHIQDCTTPWMAVQYSTVQQPHTTVQCSSTSRSPTKLWNLQVDGHKVMDCTLLPSVAGLGNVVETLK